MSANHPVFSPGTGPDAAYTPGTFNETDQSYTPGVVVTSRILGALNAHDVKLFDAITASAATGLVYAIGDTLGRIVTYDASAKTISVVWRNLTAGTLLTGVPAVTSYVPSAITANEGRAGAISGGLDGRRNNFLRPNAAYTYAAGQLIGRTTTVSNDLNTGNLMPLFVARDINRISANTRLRMSKSGSSLTGASFRAHLFDTIPVLTVGDGGVLNSNPTGTGGTYVGVNGAANYIGAYDIVMDRSFSDGAWGAALPQIGQSQIVAPASGSKAISLLLEARGAYAAAANETFAFYLDNQQD